MTKLAKIAQPAIIILALFVGLLFCFAVARGYLQNGMVEFPTH